MTLFLLLVTIAVVIPIATIALEVSKLGVIGSIVGICLAAAIGIAQFVGHHKFADWIDDRIDDGWQAELLIIAYDVAIVPIGILCALVTLGIARVIADI